MLILSSINGSKMNYLRKDNDMLRKTGIFVLLFLLAFSACKTHYSVSKKEAQHQSLKGSSSSSKFDSIISPYSKVLGNEMQKEFVLCNADLTKDGNEMTLGNFVCDAVKWAYDSITNVQQSVIVLMNRGGLRTNINKGMVTVNSIFEVMPFDNELEVVEIKGKGLEDIIKRILEKKHAFLGMTIHAGDNSYAAIIDGKAIQPEMNYYVLTSDFLINGGDGFSFGQHLISEKKLNLLVRDAIINYCKYLKYTGKTISPYKDVRLEISK
ncbi:MAG: 5'-nucleotidase [Bacteroidota bacterium]|nr:5'-nucleotidase [Bacteroidota bacterium]